MHVAVNYTNIQYKNHVTEKLYAKLRRKINLCKMLLLWKESIVIVICWL